MLKEIRFSGYFCIHLTIFTCEPLHYSFCGVLRPSYLSLYFCGVYCLILFFSCVCFTVKRCDAVIVTIKRFFVINIM